MSLLIQTTTQTRTPGVRKHQPYNQQQNIGDSSGGSQMRRQQQQREQFQDHFQQQTPLQQYGQRRPVGPGQYQDSTLMANYGYGEQSNVKLPETTGVTQPPQIQPLVNPPPVRPQPLNMGAARRAPLPTAHTSTIE